MKSKGLIRKERIIEYLDNIERQLKDIRSIPIPGKDFFLNRENSMAERFETPPFESLRVIGILCPALKPDEPKKLKYWMVAICPEFPHK